MKGDAVFALITLNEPQSSYHSLLHFQQIYNKFLLKD